MSETTPSAATQTPEQTALDALRAWAACVAAEDAAERALASAERSFRPVGHVAQLKYGQQVATCRAQLALSTSRRLAAESTLLAAAGGVA